MTGLSIILDIFPFVKRVWAVLWRQLNLDVTPPSSFSTPWHALTPHIRPRPLGRSSSLSPGNIFTPRICFLTIPMKVKSHMEPHQCHFWEHFEGHCQAGCHFLVPKLFVCLETNKQQKVDFAVQSFQLKLPILNFQSFKNLSLRE